MASAHGDAGRLGRGVQRLRDAVARVPGAKALYDRMLDRRFEKYANGLQRAVYHETNFILKPYAGPTVVTVHDLSHIRHPEFHKPEVVEVLNRELPQSIERADHVVVVSDVVRDEVLTHFAIAPERVTTVYEGSEERYRPRAKEECEDVLGRLGLGYGKYVLMVATLEPRKGVDVLLDAWQALPQPLRDEYTLVLAGSSGWRNEGLMRQLQAMIDGGGVKYLGYADTDILPQLFSAAAVFAYPSVYEGFGLPVLDAMASGVPVICRQGTSMAEFSRASCVLCETGDAQELVARLSVLLDDAGYRDEVVQRQHAAAAELSWQRCAAEMTAIYRTLV